MEGEKNAIYTAALTEKIKLFNFSRMEREKEEGRTFKLTHVDSICY